MRIKRIKIEKLFGLFDYDIPLKLDERITILTGPNGSGKTTILRLLRAVFKKDFVEIKNIVFGKLSIFINDNSNSREILLSIDKANDALFTFSCKFNEVEAKPFTIDLGFKNSSNLFYLDKGIEEDKLYVFEHQKGEITKTALGSDIQTMPKYVPKIELWFNKLIDNIGIYFVQTERLRRTAHPNTLIDRMSKPKFELIVNDYSKELTDIMNELSVRHSELSNKLDRNSLKRLLNSKKETIIDKEKLKQKLDNLKKKSDILTFLGFFDKDKTDDISLDEINEENINAINIYVQDSEKKLSIFNDFIDKFFVMYRMIKEHFQNKELFINRQTGLSVIDKNNNILSPSQLSSGEQHQLVLIFMLLFKVQKGSLILIDEPELSLHVVWQREILNDLKMISDVIDLDFILSTHSPQIINGRLDLMVDLAEQSNE